MPQQQAPASQRQNQSQPAQQPRIRQFDVNDGVDGQESTPQQPEAQQPQAPAAPGGGALRQPLFSGDHVLETVASGQAVLKPGARGPSVRAVQQFLLAKGLELGRAGADGQWGPATTMALQNWQSSQGLSESGVLGQETLQCMDNEPAVTEAPNPAAPQPVAPASGNRRTPGAQAGGQTQAQAQGGNQPAGGAPGSQNGGLPADFQKVWDAHPHNYQQDSSKNTSSSDLLVQQGWSPDAYSNTCAIRLSIMLNKVGGGMKITREKAKAAGIDPGRVPFSQKTGWFYILSAKEMWTYLTKHAGKPSQEWPKGKRFRTSDEFQTTFDKDIEPVVSGKKGIVAFDKIFGYSGTGHVDIFEGTKLSDAPNWYPSEAIKVWYI